MQEKRGPLIDGSSSLTGGARTIATRTPTGSRKRRLNGKRQMTWSSEKKGKKPREDDLSGDEDKADGPELLGALIAGGEGEQDHDAGEGHDKHVEGAGGDEGEQDHDDGEAHGKADGAGADAREQDHDDGDCHDKSAEGGGADDEEEQDDEEEEEEECVQDDEQDISEVSMKSINMCVPMRITC